MELSRRLALQSRVCSGTSRCATLISAAFEQRFLGQGDDRRDITATLDLAWELLAPFPDTDLSRIPPELLGRHRAAPPAQGQVQVQTS